jgi:hypothetical protein
VISAILFYALAELSIFHGYPFESDLSVYLYSFYLGQLYKGKSFGLYLKAVSQPFSHVSEDLKET